MTGRPDLNFPAFYRAADALRNAGHDPVNPADNGGGEPGMAWADYVRRDMLDMLTCEGLALLPEWSESRGALLEVHVARELGMRVETVEEWLSVSIRDPRID